MRGREICVTDVPSPISPVASPGGTQGLHGLEVLGPFFDLKTKNTSCVSLGQSSRQMLFFHSLLDSINLLRNAVE